MKPKFESKPLKIATDLHRQMKELAASKGVKLAEEADRAVRQYLRRQKKAV